MSLHHRSVLSTLALVLGLVAVATPVAADRDDDHRRGPQIVPVRGELDDRSAGELLGESFAPFYAVPADQFQPCQRLGEDGDVLIPVGSPTCAADEDTRVVLVFAVSCSDVEPEPYFAEGAVQQRECARNLNEGDIVSLHASVDGWPLVRLDPGRRFTVTSPQVEVTAVEGNLFGAKAGPATFVGDGWLAEVKGLSPGEHALHLEWLYSTGETAVVDPVVSVDGG